MRIWAPSDAVAVAVDIAVWAVWGVVVGYGLQRLPRHRFADDSWLTRLRPWERSGRVWDGLRVRRWKDALPDAGGLFAGGFAKRELRRRDREYLLAFEAETRRAELVHWIVLAVAPLFVLWNPLWLAAVMALYGVVANVPCIIVQRFNRGRLQRTLDRHRTRRGP
jgi:glycosyl-4,4'-diaponeurosporenoate acyltransferase